jgi:hypothetical protein
MAVIELGDARSDLRTLERTSSALRRAIGGVRKHDRGAPTARLFLTCAPGARAAV